MIQKNLILIVLIAAAVLFIGFGGPQSSVRVVTYDTLSECKAKLPGVESQGWECGSCYTYGAYYQIRCEDVAQTPSPAEFDDSGRDLTNNPGTEAVYTMVCSTDSECEKVLGTDTECYLGFCTTKEGDFGNNVDLTAGDIANVLFEPQNVNYDGSGIIRQTECADGTDVGKCSAEKPLYCDLSNGLVPYAEICGCPADKVIDPVVGRICVPPEYQTACEFTVKDQHYVLKVADDWTCQWKKFLFGFYALPLLFGIIAVIGSILVFTMVLRRR